MKNEIRQSRPRLTRALSEREAQGLLSFFILSRIKKQSSKSLKASPAPDADGFTLIEMMVVLAIIVLMSVLVLPNVSSYFKTSINSATRDIASTVKEAYNSSVVTGNIYRLVYDFKENNYWVEAGPAHFLLDTKESKEKEERKKKFSKNTAQSPSPFKIDKLVTRKKISLPTGVVFEDIFTQQSSDPITEGVAYTHFFPSGLAEQTLIHLKDRSDHHVTLAITALIGQTDLYERYVKPDEAFKK